MEGYAKDTPLGRNADPEDIVGPIAFLLSPNPPIRYR